MAQVILRGRGLLSLQTFCGDLPEVRFELKPPNTLNEREIAEALIEEPISVDKLNAVDVYYP